MFLYNQTDVRMDVRDMSEFETCSFHAVLDKGVVFVFAMYTIPNSLLALFI